MIAHHVAYVQAKRVGNFTPAVPRIAIAEQRIHALTAGLCHPVGDHQLPEAVPAAKIADDLFVTHAKFSGDTLRCEMVAVCLLAVCASFFAVIVLVVLSAAIAIRVAVPMTVGIPVGVAIAVTIGVTVPV